MYDLFYPIDLRPHIAACVNRGAAIVHRFLKDETRQGVLAEIPESFFTKAEPGSQKVQQSFERFAYQYQVEDGLVMLERLRQAMQNLIQSCQDCFPPLKTWLAVETVVQRYTHQDYLTAHKDLLRHPMLIASITLQGSAQFDILGQTRQSDPVISLHPGPGDLVLLRANGLRGELITEDVRPFHRVSGALTKKTPRISVTFRDNLDPGKPIPGFSYRNSE